MSAAKAVGHRVEDLSQRSETTQIFANPGGTWTSETASGPVRTQDEEGSWHDIDTTLVAGTDGLRPKYATDDLLLSNGGSSVLATITRDGHDVTLRWPSPLPKPTVEDDVATYPGAVDGGDLVVQATNAGLSDWIVLKKAPDGPVSYRMPITVADGMVTRGSGGSLAIKDDAGNVLMSAPEPLMWDSTEDLTTDGGAAKGVDAARGTAGSLDESDGLAADQAGPPVADPSANVATVGTSITKTGEDSTVLALNPSQDFLDDPATQYPVVVDPSFTALSQADTWVNNTTMTTSQVSSQVLVAGSNNGGSTIYRSFLKFDNIPYANRTVLSARLLLRNFDATSCTSSSIRAYAIAEPWSSSNLTWSGSPGQPTAANYWAEYTPAHGPSGCPQADANWDVGTIVKAWAAGTIPNYGFKVKALTETANSSYRRYRSDDYTGGNSVLPRLTVTYLPAPPSAPSSISVSPCEGTCGSPLVVQGTRPTFAAKSTNPETTQWTLHAQVAATASSPKLVDTESGPISSGQTGSVQVPSGQLTRGTSYVFRLGAEDSSGQLTWTGWTAMSTAQNTAPTTPGTIQIEPCVAPCTAPVSVESLRPTFSAQVSDDIDSDAISYQLQVRKSGTTQNLVDATDQSPPSGGRWAIQVPQGALDINSSYEYRLGASDPTTTTWTAWSEFQTGNSSPTVPNTVSVTPCQDPCAAPLVVQGTRPTFAATSTDPEAAPWTLHLQIAPTPTSPTIVDIESDPADSGQQATVQVPTGSLTRGNTYAYRLAAEDSGGQLTWTGWTQFTAAENTAPTTPTAIQIEPCQSPCSTPVTTESLRPTFSAAVSSDLDADEVTYRLQIHQASGGENLVDVTNQAPPADGRWSIKTPADTLDVGTSYEYRLGASDSTATTWTAWVEFQTPDSPPSVPASIEISPCADPCSSPASVDSLRPSFTAVSTDEDTRMLRLRLEVRNPGEPTNLTEVTSDPTPQSGKTTVRVPNGVLAPSSTYEYRLTAVDAHNQTEGPWTQFVTTGVGDPITVIPSGTTITADTTWTRADSPYDASGGITVAKGATLRIEPGAVIKMDGTYDGIQVFGTLLALGTKAAPIVITSPTDDSEGGDTNNDGNATAPSPSDFGTRISFRDPMVDSTHVDMDAARRRPTSILENVSFRYGGADHSVSSSPCATANKPVLRMESRTRLRIEHSEFLDFGHSVMDRVSLDPEIGSLRVLATRFGPSYAGCTLSEVTSGFFHGNIFEGSGWNSVYFGGTPTADTSVDFTANWFLAPVFLNTTAPLTRDHVSFEGNAFLAEFFSQLDDSPDDLTNNWWGFYPLIGPKKCWYSGEIYHPRLATRDYSTSECSGYDSHEQYFTNVEPAMTAPPKWVNPGLESKPAPAPALGDGLALGAGSGEFSQTPFGDQADPVNSLNGSFHQSEIDASVPALGVDLTVARTYNSTDTSAGSLGKGWSFGYDSHLTFPNQTSVKFKAPDGQELDFIKTGDGYVGATGVTASLTKPAANYLLKTRAGLTYEFDGEGRLKATRDRHSNAVEFTYSGGHLATAVNGARSLEFTYSGGHLTKVTLPDTNTISFGYTGEALTSVTDQAGATTHYEYDATGRLTLVKDPLLKTMMRLAYNATTGRVSDQWDAENHHTQFDWNPSTSTATMTDPRGNDWVDVYEGASLIRRTDPEGRTWRYTRDSDYQLTRVEDPEHKITSFDYNPAGDLITILGPIGEVQTRFNSQHQPVWTQNARRKITTMTYSTAGDLLEVTHPRTDDTTPATSESFTYDGAGLLKTSTNAEAKTTHFDYNASGDLLSVTSPGGRTNNLEYDGGASGMGRVSAQVAAGSRRTSYTYDEVGRVLTITDPLNRTVVTNDYDAAGRLVSRTDAKQRETTYTYDNADHVKTITTPDSAAAPLSYDYDTNGNLASAVDASGRALTYTYNKVNEVTATDGPQGHSAITRTPMGQVASLTQPDQSSTFYDYDQDGRLASIDYPGGLIGQDVTYGYDANGNRTSMNDATGAVAYSYNALDQLASVQRGNQTTGYAYTKTGRLRQLDYPAPSPIHVTYDYNDDGQLTTVAQGQTTEATYSYNATTGLLMSVDVGSGTGAFERNYTYDDADRLTRLRDVKANNDVILDDSYVYDATDNPTTIAHGPSGIGGQDTYTYDVQDRLTGACYDTTSCAGATDYVKWTYDPVGNRTSEIRPTGTRTYAFDAATGRLSSSTLNGTDTSYAHNALGQLTNDGQAIYTYNGAGQMAAETRGGETTSYSYDGDGKRLSAATSTDTRRFSWDPVSYQLLAERDGSDGLIAQYLIGLAAPLARTDANNATLYYHPDAQGSVRALTNSVGATSQTKEYEPYGVERSSTPPNVTQPLGFAGEYTDPGGLLHLRARQYDPSVGMFTAPDPLGGPGAADNYTYAGSNPMVYGDPSGLAPDAGSVVKGAGGIAYEATAAPIVDTYGAVRDAFSKCVGGKGSCGGGIVTAAIGLGGLLSPFGRGKSVANGVKRYADDFAEDAAKYGDDLAETGAKACSFSGATLVLMADGSKKPIGEIKVGDEVLATDPETGEQVAKTVEHVWVHNDTVTDLVVDGEAITTTKGHPFWSVTDSRFERADQLAAGEKVLDADGRVITVSGLEIGTARRALAYNLTVEGIHTYHVGKNAILVHNTCNIRGLWQITKEGTAATKQGPFGTLWKSKSDGFWWSKDTAGHGGSAWKVYEESSRGLIWRADANQYGDFIDGKHKSDVGTFIPWKDLN